jgi:hypothetical protein
MVMGVQMFVDEGLGHSSYLPDRHEAISAELGAVTTADIPGGPITVIAATASTP